MVSADALQLRLLLLVTLLVLIAAPSFAQRFGPSGPVPAGARVTLELDKPQYYLGENVLVHFHLENVGSKPFSYNYGGDYRGASRSLRFKLTATGPDGLPAADPNPSGFNMGGLSGTSELAPGAHVYFSLPLVQYCRLDKPVRYRLHALHDFGWTADAQHPFPAGDAAVLFVMPTPAQAKQVIAGMDALPAPRVRGWGEKSDPYPDFSALRYPVYLPLLLARAKSTVPREFETAIQGISSIPTPQATQALLSLTADADAGRAVQAGVALNARLPDPELTGKIVHRSVFGDPSAGPRAALIQQSWRAEFAPSVRARAKRFLTFMLECVGVKEDLPALLDALEAAVEKAPSLPVPTNYYPSSYGACTELERATLVQLQRGATPPAVPRTLAEQDFFLQALASQPSFQPAGWENNSLAIVDGPNTYLQAKALTALRSRAPFSSELTAALLQRLPARLQDKDFAVQVAACGLAQKIKDPALQKPVLAALASARLFPLPNNATAAAYFQGLRWEALKFWADCLDDPARKQDALGYLTRLVPLGHGFGANSNFDAATGAALKAQWDTFLAAHHADIQSGRQYSLDDPEVRALFPPKIFQLSPSGGTF